MRTIRILGILLGLSAMVAVSVPAARAGEWNKTTEITVNQPVQIPGNRVLAAGTYWFRIMNSTSDERNVVMIFNAKQSKEEAMLLTRTTSRMQVTGRTEIDVAGNPKNGPVLLVRWFYPGTLDGYAFVYSAAREKQIAQEHIHDIRAKS